MRALTGRILGPIPTFFRNYVGRDMVLVIGLAVAIAAVSIWHDLFERLMIHLNQPSLEKWRVDELVMTLIVVGPVVGWLAFGRLLALRRETRRREDAENEQQILAAQLQQAQKMEAIGRLTGGIAHDFNNLLMVVDGYARRAVDHATDPAAVEDSLRKVLTASESAATLVRKLLIFSHRQAMEKSVFRVSEALHDAKGLLQRTIGERIAIDWNYGDMKTCIETGKVELTQGILNLAINARDAMPNGGSLSIGARNVDPTTLSDSLQRQMNADQYVEIYVQDTGTGIDPEVLPRIFEPFYTTKERGRGTGLGLSMVYGFVKGSNGFMDVSSELGVGTTFHIYLPMVAGSSDAVEQEVQNAAPGKGETILVVEDDAPLLGLIRDSLTRLGYSVLSASSGFEALEVDEDHEDSIDVLLTDVIMPGLSGMEVANIIQLRRPNMKVLFVSGYPDEERATGPMLAQGLFLQKPIKMTKLAQAIRQELDSAT